MYCSKPLSYSTGVASRVTISQLERIPFSLMVMSTMSKSPRTSPGPTNSSTFKARSIYACPDAGDRCHVSLLDLYLSKLPQEAIQKDIFYVRPLYEIPTDPSKLWYAAVPVGNYNLNTKVKVMCERAGIQGHKTNHSLRATAATALYQADVPEKLIQERTGHRSLNALRVYERTTTHQQQAVSSLLSISHNHSSFSSALRKSTGLILMSGVLKYVQDLPSTSAFRT